VSETLREMRASFHAQAGPLRAQLEAGAGGSSGAGLEADLRRWEAWPA
jgi:hypothetical protein